MKTLLLIAVLGTAAALPAEQAGNRESRREQRETPLARAGRRMKVLSGRAVAMIAAVDNMRERLRERNLTLDSEIIAARSRMEQYLDAAEEAVKAKDGPAALDALDGAEGAIRKLEARFGGS